MTKMKKLTVRDNMLLVGDGGIAVGSTSWYAWLASAKRFSFKGADGSFVAQLETRRKKGYWYAYRRRSGKLVKAYLGRTEELTVERLQEISLSLTGQTLIIQKGNLAVETESVTNEGRIDTSFLPFTKFNVPVLPRQLVSRTRLNQRINTPLTLIYAPSGFGKSTLLNDWKQTCGYPVAWLTLDEHDNHPTRFWYSVAAAFQTIQPNFGPELMSYLSSVAMISPAEAALRLTNDIVNAQRYLPRLGLVLDDFHRVNQADIYDAIQGWLENFPANMQLVISGHTRPPLSLGHLRANGFVTELDVNNLRFTQAEGVHYLRQYLQEPTLAQADLEKLVKHAEGWAAGLTLTALALGKQEDRRQFIDTFSGAHIYLREYFMETVLRRCTPDVQAFLLKTAILKNLTGSLCDAVTGLQNGNEMLEHLWQDNLFIIRLDEQGWYKYHDLFAEMLCSQLQARFPDVVAQLHQRAARWYREQYTPADAIYHLLATEAWEEAATLIEEMALRELEQFGEDSRLLRWLQDLPESIVQKHKRLLFVYLRLANVALPKKKMEKFVSHIEASISNKPTVLQTADEREVLTEIQQIRNTWALGNVFVPPSLGGDVYDSRWGLLAQLDLIKQAHAPEQPVLDHQITELLQTAQRQQNLFVILMAGGVLVRRGINAGQLRRSEKLARQLLEQTIAQRGKLPEPASIMLAALSQVYLERNELELAEKYLAEVAEVDPNPTSTNMPVQTAILRAKIQAARGDGAEARATIQSLRNLHRYRPSGLWTDQDLLAYEGYICVRIGDIDAAREILLEADNVNDHYLSRMVQAEVWLRRHQYDMAEKKLTQILAQYPDGIAFETGMELRIWLALALFGQHKINQALQIVTDAVRLAAPERFAHPFLTSGNECAALLALVLETQNLTGDAQAFVRGLLKQTDLAGVKPRISAAEIESLAVSASISPREQEILQLLSRGCSNHEIARELSISESTVKTHLGHIYYKFDVNSRIQAITRAKALKLIQ